MAWIGALVCGMLVPGLVNSQSSDPGGETACGDLLAEGNRLIGIADSRSSALGAEKLRRALEVCRDSEAPVELRARSLLSAASVEGADGARQLALREEALSLLRGNSADSVLIPRALEAVADSRLAMNQPDEGLRLALESLAERRRLFGPETREYVRGLVWVSVTYRSVAALRTSEAELALAHRYSEQAVELARRSFGLEDPATIGAAVDLIGALEQLGRFDEAAALEEEIAPFVDLVDRFDQIL